MEHRSRDDVSAVAQIVPGPIPAPMTRTERLERWAALLDAEPHKVLNPLREYEYRPKDVRREYRVDNSPFSVAFADSSLREAGLASDKAGDIMDFFELDERQLHRAFCYCHVADSLTGRRAAQSVREFAEAGARGKSTWSWMFG